jgi:multiple sugar transport system substrate-binding protein
MNELTISIFEHNQASIDQLRKVLDIFSGKANARVQLEVMSWDVGWQRLVEYALYHHGPDVSEIGNTWTMDFVRMYELRQFSQQESNSIEKDDKFFESTWSSARTLETGGPVIWAIPWTADPRVIFYRRDILAKAGINEATAFQSTRNLNETIARLLASGVDMPLALPTSRSRRTLHNIASWVWETGGDFLTPDRLDVAFDQPETMKGIKAYFRLGRFLNKEAHTYDDFQADAAFDTGKAAVTITGSWILTAPDMHPEVRANMGVVPVPGIPFVGGSNLIVWKHTRNPALCLQLIDFMMNDPEAECLNPGYGLPVRESRWQRPPFNTDAYAGCALAIKRGQGLPVGQLWGLVEKRLVDLLPEVWTEVAGKSEDEINSIVDEMMNAAAHRLRMTLKG